MHLVFNKCPYLKYCIIIIIVAGLMKASPSNYLIYDIHEAGCSRIILRYRNQHKGGHNSPKLQTSTIFDHLLSLHPQRAQKPHNPLYFVQNFA